MTIKIKLTSVIVDDQDKALAFYADVLGFAVKQNIPMGRAKWLTVVSPEDRRGRVAARADSFPGLEDVPEGAIRCAPGRPSPSSRTPAATSSRSSRYDRTGTSIFASAMPSRHVQTPGSGRLDGTTSPEWPARLRKTQDPPGGA
jgi:hypothetical protein